MPKRNKRGRPRKVDAGPNNGTTKKCFKSTKRKKGAKGCAKPKMMLSDQFARLSPSAKVKDSTKGNIKPKKMLSAQFTMLSLTEKRMRKECKKCIIFHIYF